MYKKIWNQQIQWNLLKVRKAWLLNMKGLESTEYVIRDDEITPEMENFNCDLRRDDLP